MDMKLLIPILGLGGLAFYNYKKSEDQSESAEREEMAFLREHPSLLKDLTSNPESGDK